jgi:PTS system mannose-specific IIB component
VRLIEEIGLIRIDDRLIHGQVIAVWCRYQKFTRIAIADDGVAGDPFMRQVLSLAAPTGLHVDVFTIADAVKTFGQASPEHKQTMILLKSPLSAKRLYDEGLPYHALNIGGIGSGPGRKNIFKNISASAEEIAILKYLRERGVKITLLTVPGEQSKDFSDMAGKL